MSAQSSHKVKGVADVVFLIDITGSMDPCIKGLQQNIGAFIKRCREPDELGGGVPVSDLRISICGYRDHRDSAAEWFDPAPFISVTDSIAPIEAQLARLKASGGGDEPESLLDALFEVGSMPEAGLQDGPQPNMWRQRARRMVIAFTDATFHPTISAPAGVGGDSVSVGQLYMAKKIKLMLFAPRHACFDDLGAIDGSIVEFYTDNLKTAQKDLEVFTRDTSAFRRTLETLAKTVTLDAQVETL